MKIGNKTGSIGILMKNMAENIEKVFAQFVNVLSISSISDKK